MFDDAKVGLLVSLDTDASEDALDDLSAEDPAPSWVPDRVPDWLDGDVVPPPTFGTCLPSGWSAWELDDASADTAALSDTDLVEAIVGFDRVASWAAARQARLLAELARRRPTDKAPHTARNACVGSEFAPDEAGVALHLSRGVAADRIATARHLLTTLPATFALWETGQIDTLKARVISDATLALPEETAAAVETRILARASQQTAAQLRAALARAILAADPDGADDRHREARKDRRVHVQPEPDGMGSLWALLTATDAQGAYTWLTRLAKGLGSDDPRSMDTRRADLLGDLLNGRPVTVPDSTGPDGTGPDGTGPGSSGSGSVAGRSIQPVSAGKPLIQIVVPHSTLTGADDHPAELAGHGPIPAALAREAAANAVWRRIVTDPLSGTVLDYGRTTYHPPAGLADHVRVRDVYCCFPGCRRKAADAELDHVLAWAAGGRTSARNLRALCPHHHRLKTHTDWQVETGPDGRLTWTTPTGHRHTTEPHDYRPEPPVTPKTADPARAEPDPDPPPF